MNAQVQKYELRYKAFGADAILIEWPARIEDDILDDVARMRDALTLRLKKSAEIVDVVAAYNSITIIHRHPVANFKRRIEILKKIYQQSFEQTQSISYCYHVPVCYDPDLATDLDQYLVTKNLSLQQLINLHSGTVYRVCFFGFIPGFMYLSGLAGELQLPRKANPSLKLKKGSVAIGGQQTGIYPSESPGGWHVIGMSPVDFIGEQSGSLGVVQAGDRVCFQSISLEQYHEIKEAVKAGTYKIRREIWSQEGHSHA